MPNFEIHNKFNKLTIGVVGLISIFWGFEKGLGLWGLLLSAPAAVFSAYWLSPDLDLEDNGSLRYWPGIFDWWWRIYAKVLHHRGLSHVPILGTLTRVGWLVLPFYLLGEGAIEVGLVNWRLNDISVRFYEYLFYVAKWNFDILQFVWIGLEIPAMVHYMMDFAETLRKIKRKRLLRRGVNV